MFRCIVLPTIKLNDKVCFKANEIDYKIAARNLTTEFPSVESTISYSIPKTSLSFSLFVAQAASCGG